MRAVNAVSGVPVRNWALSPDPTASTMLGQRILTAIVLLIVLGLVLAAPGHWPLPLLLVLAAACALWEWLRLVWPAACGRKLGPVVVALLGGVGMLALLYCLLAPGDAVPGRYTAHTLMLWASTLAGGFWLLGSTTLVVQGQTERAPGSWSLALVGVIAVAATWWSLARFYLDHGAWFLVSLMALVWVADIGAYVAGKTWGKRKLAPKVSPGKSIEGALGGIVAAVAWVWISSYWPGSFGQTLALKYSWPLATLIVVGLAAISIVGDLFESLLKRRAGMKDSSNLLPGHGGVYDRIDALLPVSVLAWLLLEGWA